MLKTNKPRIYLTVKQQIILAVNFGCVRWVYNWALDHLQEVYKKGDKRPSEFEISGKLTELKKQLETAWLKDASAQSLQQAIRNLYKAFKAFFDKKNKSRYPKYKSRRNKQSATYVQGVSIVGENHIKIPKVGIVYAKGIRKFAGKIKTCVVTKTKTGKYFVSILYDDGTELPVTPKTINEKNFIGIDLGLTDFTVTNDGTKTPNPKHLEEAKCKLRKKHRSVSRKTKGSNNYKKACKSLGREYEKVANKRNDFQHKLSNKLVRENQGISIETLGISGMLKNKRLSRHISGAGWFSFGEMLRYKTERAGKHFVKVGKDFASTKICSSCDHKSESKPLSVREWTCKKCSAVHDRDINAAVNIRREGIRLLKESTRTGSPGVETA